MGLFKEIGKGIFDATIGNPMKEFGKFWDDELTGGAISKTAKKVSEAVKEDKAKKMAEMEMTQPSYDSNDNVPMEQAAPQVIVKEKGPSAMSQLVGGVFQPFNDHRKAQQSIQDKVNEISAMQFTVSDISVLQQEIQNLITLAQGQKVPLIVPYGERSPKEIVAAAKSKIEFGIMQLRSQGKNVEADFFEKELTKGNLKKVK